MGTAPTLTEEMLQVYSKDLLDAFKRPGVVAFHVPNQNAHKVQYRVKLKKMGLLPGVSDWVFSLPGGRVAYLELKDATGRQSKDQIKFEKDVTALGAPYAIARTPEEVDGILSALGVINKPVSQPRKRDATGEPAVIASRSPRAQISKAARLRRHHSSPRASASGQ